MSNPRRLCRSCGKIKICKTTHTASATTITCTECDGLVEKTLIPTNETANTPSTPGLPNRYHCGTPNHVHQD